MSDQTMFDGTNTQQQATPANTSQSDPFVDKLMAIRNENGEPKYKTVESALDALAASQSFIETLKQEKKAVEEERDRIAAERNQLGNIDDFVKKLSPNTQSQNPSATPTNTQGLSEERVAQLLQETLKTRDMAAEQQRNLDAVVGALSQVHGDKASLYISQKAKELNTTPAALKELAKANPTMALTLLGAGNVKTVVSPSQPSVIRPITQVDDNPRPVFERGVSRGGFSNRELLDMFNKSKAYTNKRIGLEA